MSLFLARSRKGCLLAVCVVSLSGCVSRFHASEGGVIPAEARSRSIDAHCWSESHFLTTDIDSAQFVQLIGRDLILYRLAILGEESLHCAVVHDFEKLVFELGKKRKSYRQSLWVEE